MEKYTVLPDVEDYENAAHIRDYRENDQLKNLIAKENNIPLLRFWEDEIDTKNVIKRLYESKTYNME